jgi:glycerate-2-kinase
LAVQVNEAAKEASGDQAEILLELASDIENIAQTGDLTAMRAKLTRGREETGTVNADGTAGVQEGFSLESLVSKLNKLKEAVRTGETDGSGGSDAVDSESQESIEELLASIAENLSKQLQAMYAQRGIQHPTMSLSG